MINRRQAIGRTGLGMLGVFLAAGALVGCQAETSARQTRLKAPKIQTERMPEAAEAAPVTITVAAAASLKNVYEQELIPLFEAQNPGITVEGIYDSSGKLQRQIEEGLPADVFMSASQKQMQALNEEKLVDADSVSDILENRIVLIVPSGNALAMDSFEDLEQAQVIALGDPELVPAGQYAKEVLSNLDLYEKLQPRISFGSNVTEVLTQVAEASADAGVVYATDAASRKDLVTVAAEAPKGSLNTRILYPAGVLRGSEHTEAAKTFVRFLGSREALAVFETYGFCEVTE